MVSIGALGGAIVLMVVIMIDDLGPAQTQSGDPLTPYRAQRETYLEKYRVEGRIEHELLIPAASGIAALVQNSRGEMRARALLELGIVQRLINDFKSAVATLGLAAQEAT